MKMLSMYFTRTLKKTWPVSRLRLQPDHMSTELQLQKSTPVISKHRLLSRTLFTANSVIMGLQHVTNGRTLNTIPMNFAKIAQQTFHYWISWKRTYLLSDVNLRVLSHCVSDLDWLHSVTMWPAGLKYHTSQTYIQAYFVWQFAVRKWAYNSLTSKLYRSIQGQHHVRSLSGPRINYTFK